MIFGNCPYDDCDAFMSNSMCDEPPKFQKLTCEACGRVVWLYHSRIEPVAYTEEGFLEEYEVDEKTKILKKR